VIFLAHTCGSLLKLADFYQVEGVVQKCDKFLANESMIPMIEKLCLVDKYKLTKTKNACLHSVLNKPDFVIDLSNEPEYKEFSAELKVVLLENGLNSAEDKISCLEIEQLNLEDRKNSAEREVALLKLKVESLESSLDYASKYYCIKCVHQRYSLMLYGAFHGVKCPDGMYCNSCSKYFSK
jgi:hypothetical protein